MDDAEKAILYAFDETGATPPELKVMMSDDSTPEIILIK